jgi:hypothetical protein
MVFWVESMKRRSSKYLAEFQYAGCFTTPGWGLVPRVDTMVELKAQAGVHLSVKV